MQSQSKAVTSIDSSLYQHHEDHLASLRQQMAFINTIGKRFVAANDRFQVHRTLLTTLRELYHFSACSILLEGDPVELTFTLSIIPCYPLGEAFLHAMIERIARAAEVMGFTGITGEELSILADFDAPDDISHLDETVGYTQFPTSEQRLSQATSIGDYLNIPLTVENRIIGVLSLFDEHEGAFDTELLQLTTMISDYAAVALENVNLREREMNLLRDAVLERQRLELIISSMAEGLLITNEKGAITSLNRFAQHLLSQTELSLSEDSITPLRLLAKRYQAKWIADLSEIIDRALSGKIILNQEVMLDAMEDAVPQTLSISAAPLYDPHAPSTILVGVVAVIDDITSHKQIDKLKDEFVSIVSHELRSPLTVIKGYTQHLIRRVERRLRENRQLPPQGGTGHLTAELPENYDLRSLNIVLSQADHLERLVNDILDLSRVQSGALLLHHSSFYLADVLTECARQAQLSAEQHSLSVDIAVHDSRIVADKVRIGQVIGNILDNAVKFSPQGGQIVVKLQEREQDYLVSISDQGIGVNPEYFDHIFERFYRVRNTNSRQYSGIGMGLYVAKVIVEAHEGRIWLNSSQGSGSTFFFTLPRVPRTNTLQL